ncbi:MAG TPA: amino acid adenylation domain-containing protein [Streptosporangiaceae bacterium]|nr:amino acid adenylation domain-containing protein [Streptosporangiaceae bacterium]
MALAHGRQAAEWNATDRAYPRHLMLHQLVERHAAAAPDAIAVMHRSQVMTYAALDAWATRWARRLRSLGIGPDATVGVHLDRTPELIAVLLGILKAHGAYVPLDPAYPREHLEYIVTDARLAALITGQGLAGPGPAAVPVLHPDADAGAGGHEPGHAAASRPPRVTGPGSPGNLAYVLYTSGSTGRPKGVAITHANAVDLLHWTAEVFAADLERVLATTSICFDCHVLEIFGPLSWGGTVVLAEAPTDIGARLEGTQVRLIHSVPSIVNDLLDADRLPATVRTAIVGGEALWPGLAEKVYQRSSVERLVNLYGPAECTSYASMATVDRSPAGVLPIGRPVANTRIYILDPAGSPVTAGVEGEICIAGEGLARGYLHRPGLTAERFVPEPFSGRPGVRMYRTGDVGRHGDQGDLMFCGRIDDQVKIRGVRVEPGEVERALLEHAAVREAAVRAAGGGGRGVLAAYVVPAGPGTSPQTLRAFLHRRLPAPLVPDVFVFLDRLPRTPNGKIDRRRLPAVVPAPCAAAQPAAPARTPWEKVLAELWAGAFEAGDIGVDADLFGFGGHSLAALRVKARLSELLGQDVPVRLLFDHPTIAGMAAEIERRFTPGPPPDPRPGRATAWPPAASDRAALSPMQLAILNRADERADAAGLLLPVAVRLSGRLNTGALVQALAAVTQRHAVLRSVVATQPDGSHRLVPVPPPAARHPGLPHDVLPLADLRGMPRRRREEIAAVLAQALFARPLRVRADPPLRLGLLRLSDSEHVLLLALHHIAGDAWSVETLCHQVLSAYAAAVHGRATAVPAPVQYADWAAEQRRRLRSSAGQAQHAYWRSQLQDLPVLRLPGDGHRQAPVGAIVRAFSLVPAAATREVREIGREERATPYMVLTAAFAVLLHQWSGQTDLVIGSPQTGRIRSELATVVGPCQDALVLRCDLSGDPSFRDVVRRVRDRVLAAHANSDVPFVLLTAEFGREPGRHPLYQASIVLQQWPSLLDPRYRELLFSREPIGDLQISEFMDGAAGSTALDVEMMLFEWDSELEIVLDCRGDVVPAGEVSTLAADFLTVLHDSLRHPGKQISEFRSVRERRDPIAPAHPSLLSS